MATSTAKPVSPPAHVQEETAACDCCGLTEECTFAYIAAVRERYLGRWICGLCAAAVDDEIRRSGRPISTAEALDRHARFSRSSRLPGGGGADAAERLVAAVSRVLRRSLDPPRAAPEEEGAAAAAVRLVRRRSSAAR